MLNKLLSLDTINRLSEERSERFYVHGKSLPIYIQPTLSDNHECDKKADKCINKPIENNLSQYPLLRKVLLFLTSEDIPISSQQTISQTLNIHSGSTLSRIQGQGIKLDLINLHRIQQNKGYNLLWEAKSKAYSFLGLPLPTHSSIGGQLHAYLIKQIKNTIKESNNKIILEHQLDDGSFIDIVEKSENELICYEIGLSPLKKEIHNCVKIWQSSLLPTKVIHIVKDSKDRNQLKTSLANEPKLLPYQDKISVVLFSKLIEERKSKQLFTNNIISTNNNKTFKEDL
jgi:hypothetical protein